EVSGSVGLCGSFNIGQHGAMFEAVHGSAPDIAGQGIANPSGLLHAAILMLRHLEQNDVADKIQNAWLKTMEDGVHTGDVFNPQISSKRANTREFANAVIERLGQLPKQFTPVAAVAKKGEGIKMPQVSLPKRAHKKLQGVDVFLHWREEKPVADLAGQLQSLSNSLKLASIDSRGLLVWPDSVAKSENGDHWRCRFTAANDGDAVTHDQIVQLLQSLAQSGMDFIKTENLYTFDGKRGYSVAQGQ
ncbi:MAG TPA: isocitrate/isopropylmalate family dehydrogenase, partial [Alphaproteobacteria bacterium]|nr:isocitrate/isopropylmalate family dehydrogenase [Alphaproteobacteria bacterium]